MAVLGVQSLAAADNARKRKKKKAGSEKKRKKQKTGPAGPTGPTGPTGSGAGPSGPTGPTGPSGVTNPVFPDNLFRVSNNLDPSKQLALDVSPVSTGQTRTLSVPDANTTIVGTDVAQTLTRKTLQAANGSQSAAVIQGAASQTAPLLVLQNSGGSEVLRLDGNGAKNLWLGRSAGAGQGGEGNVAVGDVALQANASGSNNTAVGRNALRDNTTSGNTAIGAFALQNNTNGGANTALGIGALSASTTGSFNTALGQGALTNNTTGDNNSAIGSGALGSNTTGFSNVALGNAALGNNTIGQGNIAIGIAALQSNATGYDNTAVGREALSQSNATDNTAVGAQALRNNTSGARNTAVGSSALLVNSAGNDNTAVGYQALQNTTGVNNTALGSQALGANSTGASNTAVGFQALTGSNFSNTTGIGNGAVVFNDDQVQLGNSATTTFVFGAVQNRSDARDKADVRDTALGLDFITVLRPVDFRWDMRDDYRPSPPEAPGPEATQPERLAYEGALQQWAKAAQLGNLTHNGSQKRSRFHHGLIAQDVADVIARTGIDFGGYQDHTLTGGDDVRSLGYEEFIAPLIKAIQELAAKNAALELRLAALENSRSE